MARTLEEYRELTGNWQNLFNKDGDFRKVFTYLNSGFTFPLLKNQYEKIIEEQPILKNLTNENNSGNDYFMNYYYGIDKQGNFVILMIDSISDGQGKHEMVFEVKFDDNLLEEYKRGLQLINDYAKNIIEDDLKNTDSNTTSISTLEALNRFLNWNLFSQKWVEHHFKELLKISEKDESNTITCFPVIQLPFVGINTLFKDNDELTSIHHFFGLLNKKYNEEELSNDLGLTINDFNFDIVVTGTSNEGVPRYFKNVSCICLVNKRNAKNFSLLPNQ